MITSFIILNKMSKLKLKASELRIGNWVEVIKGDYTTIQPSSFSVSIEDNYKPIPLSKKWFKKFGFETNELDDRTIYHSLNILDEPYCDLSLVETRKNGNVCIYLFPYENIRLQYVHELQNLYHSLTAKELNIKQ